MYSPDPMALYFIHSSHKEWRVFNDRKTWVSGQFGRPHHPSEIAAHPDFPGGDKHDAIAELGKDAEKL